MPREKLEEVQRGDSGVGIGGMRERIRQFQGETKIESNSSGTKILAEIPTLQTINIAEHDPAS